MSVQAVIDNAIVLLPTAGRLYMLSDNFSRSLCARRFSTSMRFVRSPSNPNFCRVVPHNTARLLRGCSMCKTGSEPTHELPTQRKQRLTESSLLMSSPHGHCFSLSQMTATEVLRLFEHTVWVSVATADRGEREASFAVMMPGAAWKPPPRRIERREHGSRWSNTRSCVSHPAFPRTAAAGGSIGAFQYWLTLRVMWLLERRITGGLFSSVLTLEAAEARLKSALCGTLLQLNYDERLRRAANVTAWVINGLVTTDALAKQVAQYEVRGGIQ